MPTGSDYHALFAAHVGQPQAHGSELRGCCPFHDDRTPSWSGNCETGLWICFGCGAQGNAHQFSERVGGTNGTTGTWQEIARWTYHDQTGNPWIDIVRFQTLNGKAFRQYDHKAGAWITKGGPQLPQPRPLYNLPRLASADEIIFVEGEKCAETLTQLGYTATTTIGGARSAAQSDFAPLRGKCVTIWPDNDEAGRSYAAVVAKQLHDIEGTVRLVAIPTGKPTGWDVADARRDSWTSTDIRSALESAQPYLPQHTLSALTIGEFVTLDIAPRVYNLSPWLPEKSLAMIHARRGIGKTLFMQSVAYTIAATGMLFGKWEAKEPRRVLYVDGELPARVIQERLRLIVNGSETEADPSFFHLIAADLQENGVPDLATQDGQKAIEEHLPAEVLILDNLSCLVRSGIENEAESWQPLQEWLLRLRRQGVTVLIVHHSGISGRQRGTTKREDILDTVIGLRQPKDYKPNEGARFEVHFEKARGFYGDSALPFEAQLHDKDGCAMWVAKNLDTVEIERVVMLMKDGFTQRDAAKELECSVGKVNKLVAGAKKQGLL